MAFANNMDQDQAPQDVGADLDPYCLPLRNSFCRKLIIIANATISGRLLIVTELLGGGVEDQR